MECGTEIFIFLIISTQTIHKVRQIEVEFPLWSNIWKFFQETSGQAQQKWSEVDFAWRGQAHLKQWENLQLLEMVNISHQIHSCINQVGQICVVLQMYSSAEFF